MSYYLIKSAKRLFFGKLARKPNKTDSFINVLEFRDIIHLDTMGKKLEDVAKGKVNLSSKNIWIGTIFDSYILSSENLSVLKCCKKTSEEIKKIIPFHDRRKNK